MNLGTSLHWVSKKMGDKVCIIEDDARVTYTELWQNIEALAKAFLKLGLKENDKVAIILPNCKEFIYSFYALSRINVISIPLNANLTAYEIEKIFDDCEPIGVITTSALYKKSLSSVVKKGSLVMFAEELFKEERGTGNIPDFNTSNHQVATINYTYRGLGKPLGAMLTHGNYHHGAIGYVRLTELTTDQRVLLVIPVSHIFTLVSCVIVPLLRGATVVIVKSFVPKKIFQAIEEHKVDFIMAVPTLYISLLRNYKEGSFNISSLRYGISGGSYLPPEMQREIKEKLGMELLQGYGLTETMPITCNPRSKNKPESLGVPGHEVKVKVVDENNNELPALKTGEILIGGPTLMKEYYNKNGENRQYLKKGWFYTGDCGYKDEDGYIYLSYLKKDIVKVGGNNVDLKEVKETLESHPAVSKAELNIKESRLWGSVFEAKVWSKKGKLTEKEIKDYCSQRISGYKIPRKIEVVKG